MVDLDKWKNRGNSVQGSIEPRKGGSSTYMAITRKTKKQLGNSSGEPRQVFTYLCRSSCVTLFSKSSLKKSMKRIMNLHRKDFQIP